jgi:ABC-type sugar transport system ATPase subunit
MRVSFEHVEKTFPGGVRALRDFSISVADGEMLVLVGPSGCGKSTVLRTLAGLEDVTSGVIRIGDRVVNDLSPRERNVAMVFQDYALYPHMTVRENLAFPLRMRKLAADERARRVAWAAELLEIGPLLDRLPRALSGGQRQRVAMGRALVREPSVSLLDEPLSNLDAVLRVSVRAEIEALQRRTGTTMLYVTHDQVEAMTLGDRVAVLHEGRLQQVAKPRELYERPANTFVAGFVGTPPMNLFEAKLAPDAWAREADAETATLGIRPEAIEFATHAGTDTIAAQVEHVELLGHETLLHVRAAGLALVVRAAGMSAHGRGDALHLRAPASAIHHFDAAGVRRPPQAEIGPS